MTNIVAIGGGHIGAKKLNTNIDEAILSGTKTKRPKVLFLPTASDDDPQYVEMVKNHFHELGAKSVFAIELIKKPSKKSIREQILSSDLIYVGGGNTFRMMNRWKRFGVDTALKQARKNGIGLSGISAGAICWFRWGNSDSRRYTSSSSEFIRVTGLGFINALVCPHYDSEPTRQKDLKRMMKNTAGVAIALEDFTAIEVRDEKYRIVKNKKSAKAFRVYWSKGRYYKEEIPSDSNFSSLEELLSK